MDVVGRGEIEAYGAKHADARGPLNSWLWEVMTANWKTPAELKARYPGASLLSGNRVVFDVKGNKYRLEVRVAYQTGKVIVLRIGTHAEYSRWTL